MAEAKNRELTIIVTTLIIVAFAAIDYLVLAILRNSRGDAAWVAAMYFGGFMAQVMLIAVWAVFAPVNIVIRLTTWLCAGLMMWYLPVFAEQDERHPDPQSAVIFGALILAGITLLQVPLWIARLALRFRMLTPGEPALPTARPLQFQLRDLLIATFLLAIAMSPLRLVLPKDGFGDLRSPGEPIIVIIIIISVGLVVNLVATLPSLWTAFVPRSTLWLAGALLIYSLVLAGIEVGIMWAMDGAKIPARELAEAFGFFWAGNFAQCFVVFLVMRIYYALGYRLRRVPRRMPPEPETTA